MRASRPTDARVVAAVRFGGSFRKVCRDGIYPARGLAATQGPRDDASIVPYRGLRCGKVAVSRLAAGLPSIVGAGFIPPGDLPVQQGSRDDASIVPYRGLRCGGSAVSRLAAAFAVVRRGCNTAARGVPAIRARRSRPPHGPFKILFSYAVRV